MSGERGHQQPGTNDYLNRSILVFFRLESIFRGGSVLVIDGNAEFLETVSEMLRLQNYYVLTAQRLKTGD